jgi:hypothetical protein
MHSTSKNIFGYYRHPYTDEVFDTINPPPGYRLEYYDLDENGLYHGVRVIHDGSDEPEYECYLHQNLDDLAKEFGYSQLFKFDTRKGDSDSFYLGHNAFAESASINDYPRNLSVREQFFWKIGFKSAEKRSKIIWLTPSECDDVYERAKLDYERFKISGEWIKSPYPEDSEADSIWQAAMHDLPYVLGDLQDDFEILGTPTEVMLLAEHEDGTRTYAIPARPVRE